MLEILEKPISSRSSLAAQKAKVDTRDDEDEDSALRSTPGSSISDLHPAEKRLIQDIPKIIQLARNQVDGAIKVLDAAEGTKLKRRYRKILQTFLGDASPETIQFLREDLLECSEALANLTREHFSVAGILHDSSERAYVLKEDRERFARRGKGPFIYMSHLLSGRKHLEDMAMTVVHEITHLVLGTEDHEQSRYGKDAGRFDSPILDGLIQLAKENPDAAMENAESIAAVAALLYFASSSDDDHQRIYRSRYHEGGQAVFEFNGLLNEFYTPRVSSPALKRRALTPTGPISTDL